MGTTVGAKVGISVGVSDGNSVGMPDGRELGVPVEGAGVGIGVRAPTQGRLVPKPQGDVGCAVGSPVGVSVVGLSVVGLSVAAAVLGTAVLQPQTTHSTQLW